MSKYKVIYDLEDFPLKKNEGGLYSILPYEKLDKHGKALFKVGLADSFDKRFEQYHTYYPLGFYYKNLLASPNKLKGDFKVNAVGKVGHRPTPEEREKARKSTTIKYYKNIETYIFNDIKRLGGQRLKTTTRITNSDEYGGDSEWFYTDESTLDTAFIDAYKIYGGKNLDNHLKNINRNAAANKRGSTYTAEIHYKIYS